MPDVLELVHQIIGRESYLFIWEQVLSEKSHAKILLQTDDRDAYNDTET